ncbi:dUTPase-like protein [Tuber borchii]|uniref:Deoxyuridine 5'-triphosphate nucleotidohydrolase n=1 Tax=Tuber borchii TaxID=42251 RepID=A0A2T7A060_TUBBO|nr:dUTPase-like protein [Tuber borchii]
MTQEEPVSAPIAAPAVTKAPVIDGPLPDTITADTVTSTTTTAAITSTSPRVLKRPSTEDLPQTPKKQKTTDVAKPTPTPAMPAKILTPFSPGEKSGANLRIRRLSTKARIPKRGSALAAGYDLYSAHDTTIIRHGKALVDTDIQMMIPVGTYGRIAPRSGLASKNFIDVGAGVIDADYRGQVKVLLFNHGDADFVVKEGDRIAQLILERIVTPEVVEVDELDETARGVNGFGSTGVRIA